MNYVFTLGWTIASSMSELGHVTNTNSPDCPENEGKIFLIEFLQTF